VQSIKFKGFYVQCYPIIILLGVLYEAEKRALCGRLFFCNAMPEPQTVGEKILCNIRMGEFRLSDFSFG
jgi:hypothetical protein